MPIEIFERINPEVKFSRIESIEGEKSSLIKLLNFDEYFKILNSEIIEEASLASDSALCGEKGNLFKHPTQQKNVPSLSITESVETDESNNKIDEDTLLLKGHLDVIEIMAPAINKAYPLSQEVIDFLMEITSKYPQISMGKIGLINENNKQMTKLPVITQNDISRGWIELKTFAQSFKAAREMYEFFFGELHT